MVGRRNQQVKRVKRAISKQKNPNVKIKKHFPNKTLKQISDKRRTLQGGKRAPRAVHRGAAGGAAAPGDGEIGAVGRADDVSGLVSSVQKRESAGSAVAERRRGVGGASLQLSAGPESGSETDIETSHKILLDHLKEIHLPEESEFKVINEQLNEIIHNINRDSEISIKINIFIKDIFTPALLLTDDGQSNSGGSDESRSN